MAEAHPTWTEDDGYLKASHVGYACWVREEPEGSWGWEVGVSREAGLKPICDQNGSAASLEIAQACALRVAEALGVLDACRKGDPPLRNGLRSQAAFVELFLAASDVSRPQLRGHELARLGRAVGVVQKHLASEIEIKPQCTEPECTLDAKVDKPHCWRHDPTPTLCQSGRDGECGWVHCPQLRDGEPKATGRHCPIDFERER